MPARLPCRDPATGCPALPPPSTERSIRAMKLRVFGGVATWVIVWLVAAPILITSQISLARGEVVVPPDLTPIYLIGAAGAIVVGLILVRYTR